MTHLFEPSTLSELNPLPGSKLPISHYPKHAVSEVYDHPSARNCVNGMYLNRSLNKPRLDIEGLFTM